MKGQSCDSTSKNTEWWNKHCSQLSPMSRHAKCPYLLTTSLQLNNIIQRIIHKHTVCLLLVIFHEKMADRASDLRFIKVERRPKAGADALSGDVHQHSGENLYSHIPFHLPASVFQLEMEHLGPLIHK